MQQNRKKQLVIGRPARKPLGKIMLLPHSAIYVRIVAVSNHIGLAAFRTGKGKRRFTGAGGQGAMKLPWPRLSEFGGQHLFPREPSVAFMRDFIRPSVGPAASNAPSPTTRCAMWRIWYSTRLEEDNDWSITPECPIKSWNSVAGRKNPTNTRHKARGPHD